MKIGMKFLQTFMYGYIFLCLSLISKSITAQTVQANDIPKTMALKGKLLLADNFNTLKEYTKEFQTIQEGWRVKIWHGTWTPTSEGIESGWVTGHNPVFVYEGLFKDVIIEVDFCFEKEDNPAKQAYCRLNPMSRELDPQAYCISTWVNGNNKARPKGVILEHEIWNEGYTSVAAKMAVFKPDTWYTMRLEVIGDYAVVSCNGVSAAGSYDNFGLPKNMLTIGVGKCKHLLRNLRIYEALPNPEWTRPAPNSEPYIPLESLPKREATDTATISKIQKMTTIFDGETLNGWLQTPIAPITIAREDVIDIPGFIKRLHEKSDPVSAFLNEQLDSAGRAGLIAALAGNKEPRQTISPILRSINNNVLKVGTILYDKNRFERVALSNKTKELLNKTQQGLELARLNRLLLEDVYAKELARSPDVSWIVKDGVLASTGAGRGVLYTEKDYHNFRLVFQVRQSSGNHYPGVLLFCQRPSAGELGIDALGGIQFAVPSGGHWDYRPGINRSGDNFRRPIKIRFNTQEWAQVEILVNSEKGIARMAVAQPVGTRAIEVLGFKDTNVKAGPIALQMHNALLFDEYKDIRIEIDPKENKLITLQ